MGTGGSHFNGCCCACGSTTGVADGEYSMSLEVAHCRLTLMLTG